MVLKHICFDFFISEVLTHNTFPDPFNDELHATFQQFSQEKNGTGLSDDKQSIRLNKQFSKLNIWYVFYIY